MQLRNYPIPPKLTSFHFFTSCFTVGSISIPSALQAPRGRRSSKVANPNHFITDYVTLLPVSKVYTPFYQLC